MPFGFSTIGEIWGGGNQQVLKYTKRRTKRGLRVQWSLSLCVMWYHSQMINTLDLSNRQLLGSFSYWCKKHNNLSLHCPKTKWRLVPNLYFISMTHSYLWKRKTLISLSGSIILSLLYVTHFVYRYINYNTSLVIIIITRKARITTHSRAIQNVCGMTMKEWRYKSHWKHKNTTLWISWEHLVITELSDLFAQTLMWQKLRMLSWFSGRLLQGGPAIMAKRITWHFLII